MTDAFERKVQELLAGRWVWVGDTVIGADADGKEPVRFIAVDKAGLTQVNQRFDGDREHAAREILKRMTKPVTESVS